MGIHEVENHEIAHLDFEPTLTSAILVLTRKAQQALFRDSFFLTIRDMVSHIYMRQYSISEAARLLGIHRATLHRWIEKRVVPQPLKQEIAGSQIRYWTDEGFAKLKQHKAEQYRKKPRRKKKN